MPGTITDRERSIWNAAARDMLSDPEVGSLKASDFDAWVGTKEHYG